MTLRFESEKDLEDYIVNNWDSLPSLHFYPKPLRQVDLNPFGRLDLLSIELCKNFMNAVVFELKNKESKACDYIQLSRYVHGVSMHLNHSIYRSLSSEERFSVAESGLIFTSVYGVLLSPKRKHRSSDEDGYLRSAMDGHNSQSNVIQSWEFEIDDNDEFIINRDPYGCEFSKDIHHGYLDDVVRNVICQAG